ncbi:MAG TPA: ferritin-like domain-containing protein [Nocardioides sp.]
MSAAVEGLQSTLAAEHAAVWLYGVLGGQTSSSAQPSLSKRIGETYVIHRSRRDQLVRWLRDADEVPVASEVAYELLNEASTPAEVSAIAIEVEHACTETYADLVGRAVGAQRRWAITAMIDAARREMRFGGTAEDLPGIRT